MKVVTSSSASTSWSAIHRPLLRLAFTHPPSATAGVSSAGHVPHVVPTTSSFCSEFQFTVYFEFIQPGTFILGGSILQTFQIHPHSNVESQSPGTVQIHQPKQQQQQQGSDVSRLCYRPVGRLNNKIFLFFLFFFFSWNFNFLI